MANSREGVSAATLDECTEPRPSLCPLSQDPEWGGHPLPRDLDPKPDLDQIH